MGRPHLKRWMKQLILVVLEAAPFELCPGYTAWLYIPDDVNHTHRHKFVELSVINSETFVVYLTMSPIYY